MDPHPIPCTFLTDCVMPARKPCARGILRGRTFSPAMAGGAGIRPRNGVFVQALRMSVDKAKEFGYRDGRGVPQVANRAICTQGPSPGAKAGREEDAVN